MSLKTLIERLEYGRQVLTNFWVQKLNLSERLWALDYLLKYILILSYLSDEAARRIFSFSLQTETLFLKKLYLKDSERFPVLKGLGYAEERERKNDVNSQRKLVRIMNPQHTNDMAKIAMTKDLIDTEEYFDQLGLPHRPEEEPEEQFRTTSRTRTGKRIRTC